MQQGEGRRSESSPPAPGATLRPADDLYRHVNGRWLETHEVAADRGVDDAYRNAHDLAEARVRETIETAARGSAVGDLYRSFMDVERVATLDSSALDADLDLVAGALTRGDVAHTLGRLQRTGVGSPLGLWVDVDTNEPDTYVVYLRQSGLGMPNSTYYFSPDHDAPRSAYRGYVTRIIDVAGIGKLIGVSAEAGADRVVDLEQGIASHHADVARSRDVTKNYHPRTFDELCADAPAFDWRSWRSGIHAPAAALDRVVLREPDFVSGFARLWSERPLDDWKLWLAFRAASARAPYMSERHVETHFEFYGRTLAGTRQPRARWRRGVALVDGVLGDLVGSTYVARHFSSERRSSIDALVSAVVDASRQTILESEWMTSPTKTKALTKLEKMRVKIGHPDQWRDFSGLELDASDLVGNIRRCSAFEHDHRLAKVGGPVDRDQWMMSPQRVNAYYNPKLNDVVFPAAILEPPFFDPEADDAVNFGAIGALIGHEISHAFYGPGANVDSDGRSVAWWDAADHREFERRTEALVAQYAQYSPAQLRSDGAVAHVVDGARTLGENISDLAGLSIAIKAYAMTIGLPLDEAPVIDGATGLQRLFMSWARMWRAKARDEDVIRRLRTTPHSPPEFRCNGVVRNIDEFYEAFDVQPGDGLHLPAQERVRLW